MMGNPAYDLISGFLFLAVLLVIPFWRILPRHGIPAPVALMAILPVGALILLWIVAFRDAVEGGHGPSHGTSGDFGDTGGD